MGHAQEISPSFKAKNGLFGKFKVLKIPFVTQSSKPELKGPKAKNQSPWAKNLEKGSPIEFTFQDNLNLLDQNLKTQNRVGRRRLKFQLRRLTKNQSPCDQEKGGSIDKKLSPKICRYRAF
jgi:hypothetical protein